MGAWKKGGAENGHQNVISRVAHEVILMVILNRDYTKCLHFIQDLLCARHWAGCLVSSTLQSSEISNNTARILQKGKRGLTDLSDLPAMSPLTGLGFVRKSVLPRPAGRHEAPTARLLAQASHSPGLQGSPRACCCWGTFS